MATQPSAWARMMQAWRWRFAALATPWQRLQARFDLMVIDHGLLRALYPNRAELAPGVTRSAQPSPRQIARLAQGGVKTIVNLRGQGRGGPWFLEAEACRRQGIRLIDIRTSSRALPPRAVLMELIEAFDTAEKPLLFHCKSGADRAGLAAVVWRLMQGEDPGAASRELSPRFLHFRAGPTGVLDLLAGAYGSDTARTPLPFRIWAATRYDPASIGAAFGAGRFGRLLTDGVLHRE